MIHWLTPGVFPTLPQLADCPLASVRLRIRPCISKFLSKGVSVSCGDVVNTVVDGVFIGKIGQGPDLAERASHWLRVLKAHKDKKKKVILDYSDPHLTVNSPLSDFYKRALELTDIVVCSSNALAESCAGLVGAKALRVIEDWNEYPCITPKTRSHTERLNLLWFGYQINLTYLISWLQSGSADSVSGTLTVLTGADTHLHKQRVMSNLPRGVNLNWQTWSQKAVIQHALGTDWLILPSSLEEDRKRYVSSNRLIAGLSLGLPILATPALSYQPFSEYFRAIAGSAGDLENPDEYYEAIAEFQYRKLPQFNENSLGDKWLELLS